MKGNFEEEKNKLPLNKSGDVIGSHPRLSIP